ncbi:GatB/YqeY domain-containing protein [Ketobacter sp.]|uniref:GatB/YqeY domain-containing protein n=1 Tax=Ketobacter sp. TaxID=2083498 RepID=UPI000F13468E|nr:GatB/YqeY domain-containing protein [Ketobacter sp.]RLT94223.1 MAG: GatB/YqeY domain-containing protein [Ketobacter sp.]
MSAIKTKLNDAVKDAMRAKDKERLATLRLATSALKQVEVDERIELDDTRVLAILDKMVKQRKDSVEQFTQGGRDDLAQKELAEIDVLKEFLPEAMDDAAIAAIIQAAIAETGAEGMKDMGNVMAIVKPQVQGRADMGAVSKKVKELLG